MKTYYLFIFMLFAGLSANGQSILYNENFESAINTFTLNSSDVSSTSLGYNQWIINNNFTGGNGSLYCIGLPFTFTVVNTPLQPNSFTNSPSSNYLHTISSEAMADNILASSFLAADGFCFMAENYFAKMSNDISTIGYVGVEFSFWWICAGSINNYGEVYYSIDGGITWINLNNPISQYQNQSNWTQTTISDPNFDNQSQLRFGFRFVNAVTTTAADPGFSIDEIQISSSCMNTSSTITVSQCGPYISPSGNYTYNSSGFYTDTIANSTGCDSIILIDLTINTNTSSTSTISSCDSYTVPSGDETYTTSGTYSDTIPNAGGCDSIITINLTIKTVDTSLTVAGNTITANATNATYQWVDCLSAFSPLPGETNQTFVVTVNGIYAVIITQNGCVDTSNCIRLDNVGIIENPLYQIAISPNPTDGIIHLLLPKTFSDLKYDIFNVFGAEIQSEIAIPNNSLKISLIDCSSGIYFIKVYNENYSRTIKVILER